eukprot:5741864-Heterocapsa_arctica.AAC.1
MKETADSREAAHERTPACAKEGGIWASLGPNDCNPGVMLDQIVPLDWIRRKVNARTFSEAMARRSLMGNAKPDLK